MYYCWHPPAEGITGHRCHFISVQAPLSQYQLLETRSTVTFIDCIIWQKDKCFFFSFLTLFSSFLTDIWSFWDTGQRGSSKVNDSQGTARRQTKLFCRHSNDWVLPAMLLYTGLMFLMQLRVLFPTPDVVWSQRESRGTYALPGCLRYKKNIRSSEVRPS